MEIYRFYAILFYIAAAGFFYLGITSKKLDKDGKETSDRDYGKTAFGIIFGIVFAYVATAYWKNKF
jgi:hypothetical protein